MATRIQKQRFANAAKASKAISKPMSRPTRTMPISKPMGIKARPAVRQAPMPKGTFRRSNTVIARPPAGERRTGPRKIGAKAVKTVQKAPRAKLRNAMQSRKALPDKILKDAKFRAKIRALNNTKR